MEWLTITDIQAQTGLSVSTIRRRLSQANVKGKRVTKSGGGVIMRYSATVCAELFANDLVSDTVRKPRDIVSDTIATQSNDTVKKDTLLLIETKYKIVLQMVAQLQTEVKHQKEINTIQAQVISAATERERHLIDQAERYGRQLSTVIQQQKEAKQVAPAAASVGMTHGTAAVLFASAVVLVAAVIIAVLLFQ